MVRSCSMAQSASSPFCDWASRTSSCDGTPGTTVSVSRAARATSASASSSSPISARSGRAVGFSPRAKRSAVTASTRTATGRLRDKCGKSSAVVSGSSR